MLGLVASITLARLLGASDRGLLAVMLTVANVTYILSSVGLPTSVEYHASKRDARTGALLGNTLAYGAVLGAIVVPAAWFLREPLADAFAQGRGGGAWVLAGLLVPLTFLQWTTGNQLSGMLRFGLFNALFALSRLAYLIVVLLLLVVVDLGVSAGLIATAVGSVVLIAAGLRVVLRIDRPSLDRRLLGSMLRYGSKLQIGSLFQQLNFRLDVIILQAYRPLAEVGHYVVAQIVAELVLTLSAAFQNTVLPLAAREAEGRSEPSTARALRHHGILAVVAVVAVAVCGPVLIYAFGPDFHESLLPLFILLPAMLFLGTGVVAAADLNGRGRPVLSSAASGIAVALTVLLDVILIPRYEVVGAAVASLVAYVAYGIFATGALALVSGIPLRELLVPRRDDFRVYPAAIRRLVGRPRR